MKYLQCAMTTKHAPTNMQKVRHIYTVQSRDHNLQVLSCLDKTKDPWFYCSQPSFSTVDIQWSELMVAANVQLSPNCPSRCEPSCVQGVSVPCLPREMMGWDAGICSSWSDALPTAALVHSSPHF